MSVELFRYEGKRVLVVGGATGMGAAAAKAVIALGAEAIVMDVASVPYTVDQSIKVDLSSQSSVDEALTQIDRPVDAVISCAGVADGVPTIMLINFISQRYIIDQLVASDRLNRGGAIAMISSAAGMAWMQHLPKLLEFLNQSDWQQAADWVTSHPDCNNYMFSKQAMCTFVANQALPLLKKGIRINSILPGPTNTPLARANADTWLAFGTAYREAAGVDALSAEQIGNTLAYLCSEASNGINGQNIVVDWGHVNAALAGAFEDPDLAALG